MCLVTGLDNTWGRLSSPKMTRTKLLSALLCFCVILLYDPLLVRGEAGADASEEFERLKELNADFKQLAAKIDDLTRDMKHLIMTGDEPGARLFQENPPGVQRNSYGGKESSSEGLADTQGDMGDEANGPTVRDEIKDERGNNERLFWPRWLVYTIFFQEVWVLLQHVNVLFNPVCQWMDRDYGIDLLKKRMYWVIAVVLGGYWAREVLFMLLAVPYASSLTLKMLLISTAYHMGKILLIVVDAKRGWSPTLGIMRLLIDHWHVSTLGDILLSLKRITLQGFDIATHVFVVRDMVRWDEDSSVESLGLRRVVMIVFIIWLAHAIRNQVTQRSTATVLVELTKKFAGKWGQYDNKERGKIGGHPFALDNGEAEFMCTASCSHGHKRCIVCHLLTRDQPPAPITKRVD